MLPIAPDTLLQQRYRILKMLGEGRFGRTYLAVDLGSSNTYCAIEELAPFAQFSSAVTQAKAVFKQEASLLYQLQHPQIPRFWTTVEEQNRLLLVRDYIGGTTYRDLLDERRNLGRTFSEAEVWQFLVELLPVIGYIHSKGTIHRDLSPEHIICRDGDRLPVPIDFGIVKEFANKLQGSPTSPHIAVGQPGYAPVEQLQSGQVYPNSDLYAVAVTAIVLLTGKEPSALFQGDSMNWDWRKWTEIDDGFANILGKMLSPHPNDRYQSAIEAEQDLRSLNIANTQDLIPQEDLFEPPTTFTDTAFGKSMFSVADRVQSTITNLNVKSIWEKPQVFIPTGIMIAILAGFGSWFGVTQLLHRPPEEPVAKVPAKQIDFNNPTIPTDIISPTPTSTDTIQPEMDRSIEKEGKVSAATPVRYKIPALAGANLDIQLLPLTIQNLDPSKAVLPIDPTTAKTTPITTPPKDRKAPTVPIAVATPIPTQVLMTIISPTGAPIDDKADRVLNWRGQLSTSGDYTIELRPIAGLPGSAFPYKLSVTQLSISPTAPPSDISPNPAGSVGSPPPLGVPLPIGGNTGLKALPASPDNTIPSNNLPDFSPIPIPNQLPVTTPGNIPTESNPPVQKRKRKSKEEQPTPRVKRERVESSEEATPPRRKRSRVESSEEATPPRRKRSRVESSEGEAPAPRQRRNRQPKSEARSTPFPATVPDLSENGYGIPPKQEDRIVPIQVPEAKTGTTPPPTDGDRKNPPANGTNDPD
jgi:serine/threonine protein kinase